MKAWLMLPLLLLTGSGQAGWDFSAAREVSGAQVGVFPHLESAGRRSLAVSGERVAVVWEDNRTGMPHVYLAMADAGGRFPAARQLSAGDEAFEPAVAALGDGRFIVCWEQDGAIWGRVVDADESGAPVRISNGAAGQVTVARGTAGTFAAWSAQRGPHRGIVLAQLQVQGREISAIKRRPVGESLAADQLYPALALPASGLVLAWEDRRAGHTRLYVTRAAQGGALEPPEPLNELRSPSNPEYGRGTGVTRVALAHGPAQKVAATWMDKREFRGGYDIYAAVSEDGGVTFQDNELVQDMFGENTPQWHPAVAVSPEGRVVVVWDDPRDGTADLWLSWRKSADLWSDDIPVGPAYGPGAQRSPSIAFGAEGKLHLTWVERQDDQPPRVLYATARWVDE